jgi:putative OPT family oligopeptide transporter
MNEVIEPCHTAAVVAPFIRAETTLPEITVKSVILAVIITAFLGAANAYLALKLGQTISASIPAAIIAMGALRFFRRHNVLENNIVQTAASAGEGVACAIAFVLPALLMTGYWHYFHYWETLLITLIGGFFGVLFSIPLRRVMLSYPNLSYPEGTAIGNVLKASGSGTAKMRYLIQGGLGGGLIVLFQTGFKILSESLPMWMIRGKTLVGLSLGFSPALLAAGFIVGIQACIALLVGILIGWVFGVPIYSHIYGLLPAANYYDMAMALRASHIRYIGVGVMLLGGAWTLITLINPIVRSLSVSMRSLREAKLHDENFILPRTERDIPIYYVGIGALLLAILSFMVFLHFFNMEGQPLSEPLRYGISLFAVVYLLVVGFLLASVCAYIIGLVGVTNNPLSGLILGSVLITSLTLLPFFGPMIHQHPALAKVAVSIVIIITTVVAIATVISGENIQDLKAGKMVGATPWKQQVMLLIGVCVAALVIGPALELLFRAYGVGGVFPRAGMDPAQMLAAPQAGLVAAVAQGVFGNSLAWGDISIGIAIAVVAIIIDEKLKKRQLRLPVLAIGIGIYLPPEITSAVVVGGALNYFCQRVLRKRQQSQPGFENSTMLACGLVAGAALMGVILAVPFVLKGSSDALRLVSTHFIPAANGLGLLVTALLCLWLYKTTTVK